MPTRNISLTSEQDALVSKLVASGEYQNASEAIRDALRALEQRRKEDALKLKALRTRVKTAAAEIERGDFTAIESADLGRYIKGLAGRARRR